MVDFAEKLDWKDGPAGSTPVTAAELLRYERALRDMRDAVNAQVMPPGDRPVAKGELVLSVADYGAVGDSVADDTAALQMAMDAAAGVVGPDLGGSLGAVSGATVYVPPGVYRTTAPLKPRSHVTLVGAGAKASRLFNDATDLFAWNDADGIVIEASMRDLWLSTGSLGGHVFNLTGPTSNAGITLSSFVDVTMTTRNATSSLWRVRDRAQFIDVKFDHCNLDTPDTRTVPAFDVSVTGNDANSVQWVSSRCHSHGATAAPFFRIESTGAWNYNLTFRDLVGEQNGGGFIHLYAVDGVLIENCPDWDMVGAYAADVYKVFPVSTRPPKNVRIENSYRIANPGGLGAGKYDINVGGSNSNKNVRIVGCTPPGLDLNALLTGDASVEGRTRGCRIVTGTTTLTADDPEEIVCSSATAMSLTLPAAISSMFGRQFRVKNVGAGVVTIGATVDGVASPTLAQWAKATYRTDGANANFGRIWYTV